MGGMLISDALGLNKRSSQEAQEDQITPMIDSVAQGLLSAAMPMKQPEPIVISGEPTVNARRGIGEGAQPFRQLEKGLSFPEYYQIFRNAEPLQGMSEGIRFLLPMMLGKIAMGEGTIETTGSTPDKFLSKLAYGNQLNPAWEKYFQNFPEERAKYPATRSLI